MAKRPTIETREIESRSREEDGRRLEVDVTQFG